MALREHTLLDQPRLGNILRHLPAGLIIATPHATPGALGNGAYIIALRLARAVTFEARAIGKHRFAPGDYLYAGSANGPGGLNARIARHLRRDKNLHWHIDQLTSKASAMAAIAYADAKECDLVSQLTQLSTITIPAPGFGSTDCTRCQSHLLAVA